MEQTASIKEVLKPYIIEAEARLSSCQGPILIVERDPYLFLGAFFAAIKRKIPVFLGNPDWRAHEWQLFFDQVQPEKIFGQAPLFDKPLSDSSKYRGFIMIPTGGTTGKLRFAMHTWENLENSAKATAAFLGLSTLSTLNILPIFHVSGLMPVVRAWVSGGFVRFLNPKDLQSASFLSVPLTGKACISLVPTQLGRIIDSPEGQAWLRQFAAIFLGGAPAPEALLIKAREYEVPLAFTYGSTETASMVTLLRPADFLKGKINVGQALPHANLSIESASNTLSVEATSLFYGYYPDIPQKKAVWESSDFAQCDSGDFWRILGRQDDIIITGGEKVDPREVEVAILATGLATAALVCAQPDPDWGQKVVAFCVNPNVEQLKAELKKILAPYKIPKLFIPVKSLPAKLDLMHP